MVTTQLEGPPASNGEAAIALRKIFKPALVLGVALLSLAHDALEFFDRVDFRRRSRRGCLDQMSIVPLASTAKPPHHG